ncbi:hypothetical protein ACLB2K_055615 [Fragaria x ananassa]
MVVVADWREERRGRGRRGESGGREHLEKQRKKDEATGSLSERPRRRTVGEEGDRRRPAERRATNGGRRGGREAEVGEEKDEATGNLSESPRRRTAREEGDRRRQAERRATNGGRRRVSISREHLERLRNRERRGSEELATLWFSAEESSVMTSGTLHSFIAITGSTNASLLKPDNSTTITGGSSLRLDWAGAQVIF